MQVTSHILYELDKVGCGVAYGKIALLPVEMVKPLPRVSLQPLPHPLAKLFPDDFHDSPCR